MSQQLAAIRQQIDSNNAAFMATFRRSDSAGWLRSTPKTPKFSRPTCHPCAANQPFKRSGKARSTWASPKPFWKR